MKMLKRAVVSLVVFSLGGLGVLVAQVVFTISITTPKDGFVLTAGNSLTIQVSAPSASGGVEIGSDLFRELPSMPDILRTSPPFTFTFSIPTDVSPGLYSIQAFGRTSIGTVMESAPVNVTIESPAIPVTVKPQPRSVVMIFRGEQNTISILGQMADGSLASFNGVSLASCQSTTPSVVQVVAQCTAVAIGPGTATITVHVASVSVDVPVTVQPFGLLGDFDGDGDIDADDINRLTFWRGQTPSPTGDDRDLNHDRKIDALDARVLTTMCTRPRCENSVEE